jgi:tetratricopeptide (TPR) repeat protein
MTCNLKLILFLIIGFLICQSYSFAQSKRELINEGVDLYNEGKYTDSEVNFRKGIEKEPKSFVANFNLGDSYYKQGRYDESVKAFQNALNLTNDKLDKAKVFHNIGNSLLKSNRVQESIESYKNALKLNPDDQDTKYNLSYALSLLNKNQQNQQNKNDKNQQNNQNQNQNSQNKNDQQNNKQDNKQNQQQSSPQQNQTTQQDNLKQPQQKENQISKEQAERILDALKNNEKDLQKQLRKRTGKATRTSKDW